MLSKYFDFAIAILYTPVYFSLIVMDAIRR